MTISKKFLQETGKINFEAGVKLGKDIGQAAARKELLANRQLGVIEISRAVADLAMANAKLTYALSRITDKLL